jgi:hypothetical protein
MNGSPEIVKYPRTLHLEGSRLSEAREFKHADKQVPLAKLRGAHLVVEEKIDGSHAAISFSPDGELLLQSRGHYLIGGPAERQFTKLKGWAAMIAGELLDRLEDRHVIYGEWLQAKHTVFYDLLPHLFLEFDVYDRQTGVFLSTDRRRELLAGLPIASVPVLHEGEVRSLDALRSFVRPSLYKSADWPDALAEAAARAGVPLGQALAETEPSLYGEGLYVKEEWEGAVVGRYKWVRPEFINRLLGSGSHWAARPLIENRLAPGSRL